MSNQKNICNVMREQWRAIISLIDYLSSIMRRMLNQMAALMDRVKNTILKSITNAIVDVKDILAKFMGLRAIDNNAARKDFCRVLYACKPALEILSSYISKDLFSWIFGPDEFKTFDLSSYGIAKQTFSSKFEVFEYVACRLSLSSMFDSFTDKMINNLMDLLSKYEKYLSLDWWLKNTVVGRVLSRLLNEYEAFFNNRIKPLIRKIEPFMNCSFALCDFNQSTVNYLDDFQNRYSIGMKTLPDLSKDWQVDKNELTKDLDSYFTQTKNIMEEFSKRTDALDAEPDIDPDELSSTETTPYSKSEQDKLANVSTNALVPKLKTTELQKVALRSPVILKTPNSSEALA